MPEKSLEDQPLGLPRSENSGKLPRTSFGSKILTVANREYRAIVGTKAFLLAVTLLPIMMFGGIAVQKILEGRVGPTERKILVVDSTGNLFEGLAKAAEIRNGNELLDLKTGKQIKPRYLLEAGPAGPLDEAARFELSERIRTGKLDAFLEIPAGADAMPAAGKPSKAVFHANNAAISEERNWLQMVLSDLVRTRRLRQAGIDPALVMRAGIPVQVEPYGLVDRATNGEFSKPQQATQFEALFIPFGIMMLMWVVVFLAAQPMMESVIEEKSQRIAEVLLGSVNTFQLMMGKLLGGVAGSLSVVALYGLAGVGVAWYFNALHLVPLRVVPWFVIYQALAVMFFGSIFMAIGSAVNQVKEAQSMLLPVWLVLMIPMFVWLQIVREPMGSLATWLSFFPPATPLVMTLRIAASSAVPWWQALAGIVVLLGATLLCVLASARIFRIGFLSQGKTPNLAEILRWAVRG